MGEIDAGGTEGVWLGVMLVGAAGGGGTVNGVGAVVGGAETAIERVARIDCSGVAVDCDDAAGRFGVVGTGAAVGGAGTAVERVTRLVGTGCSSSSLLLEKSVDDSTIGSTGG